MRNVEIKARLSNLQRARDVAVELGAEFSETLHQRDVYFKVRKGRLKLRYLRPAYGELIYYHRSNQKNPRPSDFQICPALSPDELEQILTDALGVWIIVTKVRELYLLNNVRIHLDAVEELGEFIELEAVMDDTHTVEQEKERVKDLMQKFGIINEDLLSVSYSDLLSEKMRK